MAFQLRIARGHQEGRSYLVGQRTTRVGAGDGNDVVLSDAGVSAAHLQIVERDGRYFVSDLQSSNGTWVNGEAIDRERELKSGDALAVGAALLSFIEVAGESMRPRVPVETSGDTRPERVGAPGQATAPVSVRPFADDDATAPMASPLPVKKAAAGDQETTAPDGLPLGARAGGEPTVTGLPLASAPEPSDPSINRLLAADGPSEVSPLPLPFGDGFKAEPSHDSLPPLEISKSELSALRTEERPMELSEPSGRSLHDTHSDPTRDERPTRRTDALAPRVRRQGPLERLGALEGWARTGLAALAGLLVVLLGAVVFRAVRSPGDGGLPAEPDQLTAEVLPYSFGLGPGVDFERPDEKVFSFQVPASPAAAVLVHYEAKDVKKGDVSILLNGTEVGLVPPDLEGVERRLETLLPVELLERGKANTLVFDAVKNPPGRSSWRVARLSVQLLPLSPLSADEAYRVANEKVDQGNQLYAHLKVAPQNLFLAFRAYREAWQTLVGTAAAPSKRLFSVAKAKADEVNQQLDRECGKQLLEAKKQMELKQPQLAKQSLDELDRAFPGDEHPCRSLANQARDEYLLR